VPGQPCSPQPAPVPAAGGTELGEWDRQDGHPQGPQLHFIFTPQANTPRRVQVGGPWGAGPRRCLSPQRGAGTCLCSLGWALRARGESAHGTRALPAGSDSGGAGDKNHPKKTQNQPVASSPVACLRREEWLGAGCWPWAASQRLSCPRTRAPAAEKVRLREGRLFLLSR